MGVGNQPWKLFCRGVYGRVGGFIEETSSRMSPGRVAQLDWSLPQSSRRPSGFAYHYFEVRACTSRPQRSQALALTTTYTSLHKLLTCTVAHNVVPLLQKRFGFSKFTFD